MKSRLSYIVLFLLGYSLTGAVPFYAQTPKKKGLKKGPNIALHITDTQKKPAQTYFNLGLLSNYSYLKGADLSLISSITHYYAKGFQLAGFTNITGINAYGMQVAGIANVTGMNYRGVALSGLMNVSGKKQQGMTLSGIGNIAGSHSSGFHIGGLLNIAGERASGVYIAGLANIAGASQRGLHLGGLMNVTADTLKGAQITSLINVAAQSNRGVQVAALGNVAIENKGVQVALANYAVENKGVQLGLANIDSVGRKSVQLGFINISKDSAAHQFGCINLKPTTRTQMIVSIGNFQKLSLGVRFKNRYTYTDIGGGLRYAGLNQEPSVAAFYRAGIYYPIGSKLEISADAGFHHIENFGSSDLPSRMCALQPRINVEYKVHRKVGLFISGGYQWTRFYGKHFTYQHKPTLSAGIILF